MSVEHHLPDDLLLGYAAGTTAPAWSLMCATHLTLCPRCRHQVAECEALGGVLLDEREAEADPGLDVEPLLAGVLGRLGEGLAGRPAAAAIARPPDLEGLPLLPQALGEALARAGQRGWRFLLPGVRYIDLPLHPEAHPARVLRLSPGYRSPKHAHFGQELTLVLSGGLVDAGAHFARGDVAVRDREDEHVVQIDPDEECVALLVSEGPTIPRHWAARLFNRVVRF